MADGKLRAAILVVSDTASQDPSTDKVGDTLTASFTAEGSNSWDPPVIRIVPDNVLDIQRTICNWTDGPNWFNLVLISGGTGFAVKDNTPEVCYAAFEGPKRQTDNLYRLCHLSSIAMRLALCKPTAKVTY